MSSLTQGIRKVDLERLQLQTITDSKWINEIGLTFAKITGKNVAILLRVSSKMREVVGSEGRKKHQQK